MPKTSLRSVPDTNIVLASEMSAAAASPNKEFFSRWRSDEFSFLFSKDTLHEYIQKLREKGLPEGSTTRLVTALLNVGIEVSIEYYHMPAYPFDTDDIAFILCADNGQATHLVTYDRHLLELDSYYSFWICKTTDFLTDVRRELES